MSLFKRLFQKEEKNDIEKYMEERKETNKEDLMNIKETVNEVPEDLIYTKQTEEGIYFFVNYWNDGTLLMHNPAYRLMDVKEGDLRRYIKLTYKLLYHRSETIEALVAKMKDVKKKEDAKQIFFELENLTEYIIDIELPNKEEYPIYRDMGQSKEFMETYLEICKKIKKKIRGSDLFSRCIEAAICEGNVEYAVKWTEEFLHFFQMEWGKQKEIAKKWHLLYVWECKTYFKNYNEFKSRLTEDGFSEFVDGLEENEDKDEEPEFEEFDIEEKKMRESIEDIVQTIKENPAAAIKKWISLVQEKETSQEWEDWQWELFTYFPTALYFEFGDFRGLLLLAEEFMKHEEWFHYLVYARENAYSVGDDLMVLSINQKYQEQIDKIIKILYNAWNEEEWENFKKGYTCVVFDTYNIEKDALNQFVPEEAFIERHNKHFEEILQELDDMING